MDICNCRVTVVTVCAGAVGSVSRVRSGQREIRVPGGGKMSEIKHRHGFPASTFPTASPIGYADPAKKRPLYFGGRVK